MSRQRRSVHQSLLTATFDASLKRVQLEAGSGTLADTCAELCILSMGLSSRLSISSTSGGRVRLELLEGENFGTFEVLEADLRIQLARRELELILTFFLSHYSDPAASATHLDVEVKDRSGHMLDLVVTCENVRSDM